MLNGAWSVRGVLNGAGSVGWSAEWGRVSEGVLNGAGSVWGWGHSRGGIVCW